MELDYRTIKALSSPTRITILDRLLEKDKTPTALSDDLDKSKSTISSHLSVLLDAGLVEKDEEEGRRRVVYSPTSKAEAIVKGRERRIRFSVTSAIVSAFLLLGAGWTMFQRLGGQAVEETGGAIGTMDTESMNGPEMMDAAETGGQFLTDEILIAVIALTAGIFIASAYISILMQRLPQQAD